MTTSNILCLALMIPTLLAFGCGKNAESASQVEMRGLLIGIGHHYLNGERDPDVLAKLAIRYAKSNFSNGDAVFRNRSVQLYLVRKEGVKSPYPLVVAGNGHLYALDGDGGRQELTHEQWDSMRASYALLNDLVK